LNLEDLATRCLQAAVLALLRDAAYDEEFDWKIAANISVDMAAAIRCRSHELTRTMGDDELALFAESFVRDDSPKPS